MLDTVDQREVERVGKRRDGAEAVPRRQHRRREHGERHEGRGDEPPRAPRASHNANTQKSSGGSDARSRPSRCGENRADRGRRDRDREQARATAVALASAEGVDEEHASAATGSTPTAT